MRYIRLIRLAANCSANVLLGGSFDETMSSRAWRMEASGSRWGGFWRRFIDAMFYRQPQHCYCQYSREKLCGGAWKSLNSPRA